MNAKSHEFREFALIGEIRVKNLARHLDSAGSQRARGGLPSLLNQPVASRPKDFAVSQSGYLAWRVHWQAAKRGSGPEKRKDCAGPRPDIVKGESLVGPMLWLLAYSGICTLWLVRQLLMK